MARRYFSGGICELRELISEFYSELAFDFRSRFNLSVEEIGYSIRIREAIALISVLGRDPSSWVHAAVNKWRFPASRDWQIAADLWDLTFLANSEKGTRNSYPRPWGSQVSKPRANPDLSQAEIFKRLDSMRSEGA